MFSKLLSWIVRIWIFMPRLRRITLKLCHVALCIKNSVFIIYLFEDEQELSLGMLIRLQRIYNFLLFHAIILSFLDVLQSFYNHFISFLVLTYWHSAQCPLLYIACFLHRRKSIPNGVQTQRIFLWIFSRLEDTVWAKKVPEGCSEGSTTHQGAPGPRWVVPTSVASHTASSLYKYPNTPETLGESTKINSSRRKFQNHQIQSRHHHRGVHHFHWCLSDDAWVVLCRPSGL